MGFRVHLNTKTFSCKTVTFSCYSTTNGRITWVIANIPGDLNQLLLFHFLSDK